MGRSFSVLTRCVAIGGAFAFFKASVLLVPFVLAAFLDVVEYAKIESAIAVASVLVVVLNFGVCTAIPLFELKENTPRLVSGVYLHVMMASLLSIVAGILFFAAGFNYVSMVAAILSVFALQRLLSTHSKTRSKIVKSSFFESFFYFVLLAYSLFSILLKLPQASFLALLLVASVGLLLCCVYRWSHEHYLWSGWRAQGELYRFSSGALFVGVFIVFSINYVKVLGLAVMSGVDFSRYAFGFRVFSLAVFAFQLVMTVKFKYMYSQPAEVIDRAGLYIVLLVMGGCAFIALLYKYMSSVLLQGELLDAVLVDREYWVFIVLMPVWCVSAVLENVIARERLIGKHLRLLIVCVLPLLVVAYVMMKFSLLSYGQIVFGHSFFLGVMVLSQLWCLRGSGLIFRRVEVFVFSAMLASVFGAYISS